MNTETTQEKRQIRFVSEILITEDGILMIYREPQLDNVSRVVFSPLGEISALVNGGEGQFSCGRVSPAMLQKLLELNPKEIIWARQYRATGKAPTNLSNLFLIKSVGCAFGAAKTP